MSRALEAATSTYGLWILCTMLFIIPHTAPALRRISEATSTKKWLGTNDLNWYRWLLWLKLCNIAGPFFPCYPILSELWISQLCVFSMSILFPLRAVNMCSWVSWCHCSRLLPRWSGGWWGCCLTCCGDLVWLLEVEALRWKDMERGFQRRVSHCVFLSHEVKFWINQVRMYDYVYVVTIWHWCSLYRDYNVC